MKKNILTILSVFLCFTSFSQNVSIQIEGNTAFAVDFLKFINNDSTNFVFSPLSVSSSLAMTYEGAEGNTARQMKNVLNLFGDKETVRNSFYNIMRMSQATRNSDYFNLKIHNSIWAQFDFKFLYNYVTNIEKSYNAEVNFVNFADRNLRDSAIKEINEKVSKNTQNKITEILAKDDIDYDTKLVLINAVYFSAMWKYEFKQENSELKKFNGLKKSTKVSFMKNIIETKYFETETFQYLEIPYKDDKAKMCIILPKKKNDFLEIKSKLTYDTLKMLEEKAKVLKVELQIPKFKIENKINLSYILSNNGMDLAFSAQADFSSMACNNDLQIDKVLQQAFINIDEKGTEATAASAVVLSRNGAKPVVSDISFEANKPFLFFIRDNKTTGILFMGQILNL